MRSKLWRLGTLYLVLVMVVSLIMACAPPDEDEVPSPIEVTDQLGRVVKLEKFPERIISLAPGNTEILFALGLGDKVVGVTDFCNYPTEAQEKLKIGGFSTPNIEEVVALSPELILATERHEASIIPALEGKGLAVFALDPKTLDEILEAVTLVGDITGNEEVASQLVTEMSNRIKAVTDKTDNLPEAQRLRVLYICWHDPLKTAGGDTHHEELIVKAGGINIAHDLTGFPMINLETVIDANPQVIITGAGMGTGENKPLQLALTEPRLADVDARINNRIYAISTDLSGRAGPRIVDGLEKFAESIHPELFVSVE
ncbi:MAG TPA: ABC transporter substrate-binding protein [Dehalococcoidia bacterium]|jgi:iron complex transport system substrate-binding protein|nr:ABC transporter substrate-binding protein [Dehalococcoidia bacterium]